jgi:hypothetical protein
MREHFVAVYAARASRGFRVVCNGFGLMRELFAAVYATGRRGGSGWFVMVRVDARAFCGGVRCRASRGFRVVCNGLSREPGVPIARKVASGGML